MNSKTRETLINRRFLAIKGGRRPFLSIAVSAFIILSTFLSLIPFTAKTVYADEKQNIDWTVNVRSYCDNASDGINIRVDVSTTNAEINNEICYCSIKDSEGKTVKNANDEDFVGYDENTGSYPFRLTELIGGFLLPEVQQGLYFITVKYPGDNNYNEKTEDKICVACSWGNSAILFHANNGTDDNDTENLAVQFFSSDESPNLNNNPFNYDGYVFRCWNTQQDGSGDSYMDGAVVPSAKVTDQSNLTYANPTNYVLNLYAQWDVSHSVTVQTDGQGTATASPAAAGAGTVINLEANPDTGNAFKNWSSSTADVTFGDAGSANTSFTMPDSDVTVTAHFEPVTPAPAGTWKITFDPNQGEGRMDAQTVEKGRSITLAGNGFSRPGHRFKNWNTKKDGSGDPYEDKAKLTPASDMTLYAQWEENKPEPQPKPEPEPEPKPEPEPEKENKEPEHKKSKKSSDSSGDSLPPNPDALTTIYIENGEKVLGARASKQIQGPAAQFAFKQIMAPGCSEAFSFNLLADGKTVDYTLKKGKLILFIPDVYKNAGRVFALTAIDKNMNVHFYPDTDNDPATVTVNINFEGYAFDVIYAG